MSERKKLWDVNHPYYCNEGNYFASSDRCHSHYMRWQDFMQEQGDDDLDMNLVFRWDWRAPHEDDDEDKPLKLHPDPYYRDSQLKLFYMGQRKGLYRWVTVDVCQADEPAVYEWLKVRWEHMQKLWEPFGVEVAGG